MNNWVGRSKIERARDLRRRQTPAEAVLRELLRTNKTGFHFRRQCPRSGFYLDFVCLKARLVVEVDGGVHKGRVEEDALRTGVFNARGYVVLRFPNEKVLAEPDHCVEHIAALCRERIANRRKRDATAFPGLAGKALSQG